MQQRIIIMVCCWLLWHGDSIAQSEERMPAEMARKVTELNAQVEALYQEGKYDAGLQLARDSLAVLQRYLGSDHPDIAEVLNNIAMLYMATGEQDQAVSFCKRALAMWEKTLGPDHPDVATALNNLAALYQATGDHHRALPLAQRALTIFEKALGPSHPDVGTTLNNLGALYEDIGDYDQSFQLYERSLALWEEVLGPEHLNTAYACTNLGDLYYEMGSYDEALRFHERARAIREKGLVSEHPLIAQSLGHIAGAYHAKGDYAKALPLYESALALHEKALGLAHPEVAKSLDSLAGLYQDKGDYDLALQLVQRALTILEEAMGPAHPEVATALNNLASVYEDKGDHDTALPLYERSLSILEDTFGPAHPRVAITLSNLARVYRAKGRYDRALPLHQRTLTIMEKALGASHRHVATSLQNLAELYQAKAAYDQALPRYERSLAIRKRTLGSTHPDVAATLHHLASLHWARGDIVKAVHHARAVEDAREVHLRLVLVADSELAKRMFLATLAGDIDTNLSLALQTSHPAAMHLALTKVLRRKGRVLDSMATTLAACGRNSDTSVRMLCEEYRSNRSQYATQLMRGPERIPPEQHRKNLDALKERAMVLERLLGDKSRELRDAQRPITVDSVQAALPRNTALVEWIRYRPFDPKAPPAENAAKPLRYAACVLFDAGAPRCIDLGEAAAIDARIDELRDALSLRRTDVPAHARALDAVAMAPVRALLGERRWLFLAPDGPLNLVPFAALMDEQGRYLVESYSFTYLTSGRDLLRRDSRAPNHSPALVIGDPDYGTPAEGFHAAFSPLPNALREAELIASLIPGARLLTSEEATESTLATISAPRILHIAGHAYVRVPGCPDTTHDTDDPMLRSGIALAGANLCRSDDHDGRLSAMELTALDLRGTKLAVLSACETGVGEADPDHRRAVGDGLYGLRRALVVAGAETQVMSLWSVDDRAARFVMESYYRRVLAGEGRSEAMRQVQLELIRSGDNRAHPFYWAAFIVSGDDSTLAGEPPRLPALGPRHGGCACDAAGSRPSFGLALLILVVACALRRRPTQRS